MEEIQLCTNWDDVTCPICLDFPHNCVLLQCSSYEKGCRPFICDTDHLQSNCLDRFKEANEMVSGTQSPSSAGTLQFLDSGANNKPACPLCRGEVTGWIVIEKARADLDVKSRHCEQEKCPFTGSYVELQKHAQEDHPHARSSKIDHARQLDWENFQQSSEIIDVLSTIHAEIPHGVVLGDYVIEYGGDTSGDDFDDFPGNKRKWWKFCRLYQVFKNFRTSRNRRRSRISGSGRGNHRFGRDVSNSDEGSVSPVENAGYRAGEIGDEFTSSQGWSQGRASQHRSQRHLSRFYDN